MTYLLMQTFMLLLASYFLGAMTACLIKRALRSEPATVPAGMLTDQTVSAEGGLPQHVAYDQVSPRQFELVQPKIEIIDRPEPYPPPKVADIGRFDRALSGPDPNENMPRVAVVEILPAVLERATGDEGIFDPSALPEPVEPSEDVGPTDDSVWAHHDEARTDAAHTVATEEPEAEQTGDEGYTPAHVGFAGASAAAAAMGASFARSEETEDRASAEDETADEEGVVAHEESADHGSEIADEAHEDEAAEEQYVSEVSEDEHVVTSDDDEAESLTAQDSESDDEAGVEADDSSESYVAFVPDNDEETEPEVADDVAEPDVPLVAGEPVSDGDDLQRIRAIDFETEQLLKQNGYLRFVDIASWTPDDIDLVDAALDLDGRIDSEQWVEQAQILAKGGETYYSRNRAASIRSNVTSTSDEEDVDGDEDVPTAEDVAVEDLSEVDDPEAAPAEKVSDDRPKSVSEVAAAAAAAIAAASASVTRGIRPIEPISPLSKVDPKIRIPARLQDAIRERGESDDTPETDDGAPIATPSDRADDLKRIRGIGVLIEKRLNALGINSYEQIANWTRSDIDRVSLKLEFSGRIERENWVEQARILVGGGQTEFSRRVDRGEVDSSKQ